MAKTKLDPSLLPYRLYTRCAIGREPKTWVSVPEFVGGHCVGHETMLVPKYGMRHGALIAGFSTYKELVAHARTIADMIEIPKSRVWDILDWNKV